LRITWARDRFEILDDKKWETYGAKETLRSAGGMWDGKVEIQYPWGVTKGVWYITPDRQRLEVLRSLKPTITPEAKAEFEVLEQTRQAAIQSSRAVDASIDIPVNPGMSYLPYQRGGVAYAASHPNTLFGDEMGLGKTIQAIGAFNADPSARFALIVCPSSLKLNWKREWEKWDVKHSGVCVVEPGKVSPFAGDVVIINYDLLKKYRAELRKRDWDMLIVDEAHYLKNGKTGRTKEVFGCKQKTKDGEITQEAIEPLKAKRRLFLTGTPIVNRPKELWTLIESLCPTFEKSFMSYAMKYCGAVQTRWGWDFNGATRLDELQDRLRASFMVRRLKADVLKELPPKRRHVLVVDGGDELTELLEKENKTYEQYAAGIQDEDIESPAFADISRIRREVAIAKIPFLVDHVKEVLEEQDKVVVMVHHHEVVDALVRAFGGSCVSVDGRTANEDRQAAVDRFQQDETCKVFVGTIRAAGVGLTLTASSTVIFGELDWVPGNVTQAEDRCHRIGQRDSVFIQHLVLAGSLDERMAQIIIDKQAVIDNALDTQKVSGAEAPLTFATENAGQPATALTTTEGEGAATGTGASVSPSPTRTYTIEEEHAALMCMRILAGMCDGAVNIDDRGFNKLDTNFGKSLASQSRLSEKQFKAAKRMANFYRRQLPQNLLDCLGIEKTKSKETK
jgi:SNF2 family DNA or RNA helicase